METPSKPLLGVLSEVFEQCDCCRSKWKHIFQVLAVPCLQGEDGAIEPIPAAPGEVPHSPLPLSPAAVRAASGGSKATASPPPSPRGSLEAGSSPLGGSGAPMPPASIRAHPGLQMKTKRSSSYFSSEASLDLLDALRRMLDPGVGDPAAAIEPPPSPDAAQPPRMMPRLTSPPAKATPPLFQKLAAGIGKHAPPGDMTDEGCLVKPSSWRHRAGLDEGGFEEDPSVYLHHHILRAGFEEDESAAAGPWSCGGCSPRSGASAASFATTAAPASDAEGASSPSDPAAVAAGGARPMWRWPSSSAEDGSPAEGGVWFQQPSSPREGQQHWPAGSVEDYLHILPTESRQADTAAAAAAAAAHPRLKSVRFREAVSFEERVPPGHAQTRHGSKDEDILWHLLPGRH